MRDLRCADGTGAPWERARRRTGIAFVWPGSHTKLVEVDAAGRITRSQTSLAGELLQAVGRHTLIAASLPAELPDQLDPEAAEAGAAGRPGQGLQRAAFLVRIAAPGRDAGTGAARGVLDRRRGGGRCPAHVRHPILAPGRPVWVGGREPLRTLVRPLARAISQRARHAAGRRAWPRRPPHSAPWRSPRGMARARDAVTLHPSLNRLHDQTTWPMMRTELGVLKLDRHQGELAALLVGPEDQVTAADLEPADHRRPFGTGRDDPAMELDWGSVMRAVDGRRSSRPAGSGASSRRSCEPRSSATDSAASGGRP